MAYYLVTAKLKSDAKELANHLQKDDFLNLEPFGRALTFGLKNARIRGDGYLVWEEEDYCTPPLKEEKEAVLDRFFTEINVEKVSKGEGWNKIEKLPVLFKNL
jgi:hypothetical protein